MLISAIRSVKIPDESGFFKYTILLVVTIHQNLVKFGRDLKKIREVFVDVRQLSLKKKIFLSFWFSFGSKFSPFPISVFLCFKKVAFDDDDCTGVKIFYKPN